MSGTTGRILAVLGLWALLGPALPGPAAADSGSIWHDIQWTDIAGRTWDADALDGKVVLLDFWATWCAPCLAEIPHLRRLSERFGSEDLVVVGIALDTLDRRRLRSFLLRHDVQWPQIHIPEGTDSPVAREFAVETVPVTVLVDRQGRVIARDLRGRALEAVVRTLIPSTSTTVAP